MNYRARIKALRVENPLLPAVDIARSLKISREAVRFNLQKLGLPTAIIRPGYHLPLRVCCRCSRPLDSRRHKSMLCYVCKPKQVARYPGVGSQWERKRALQLCGKCADKSAKGKSLCLKHLAYSSRWRREQYHRLHPAKVT